MKKKKYNYNENKVYQKTVLSEKATEIINKQYPWKVILIFY